MRIDGKGCPFAREDNVAGVCVFSRPPAAPLSRGNGMRDIFTRVGALGAKL